MPIWFLGWIGYGIFYVNFSEFQDRLAAIATLMIAYIAHLMVIRSEVPPTNRTSLIYWLVYGSIFVNIACMIDSINRRNNEEEMWQTWAAYLTMVYQGLFFLVIIVFIFCHMLIWKPSYTIKPGIEMLLNPFDWKNEECNNYFNDKVLRNNDIEMQIVPYPSKQN